MPTTLPARLRAWTSLPAAGALLLLLLLQGSLPGAAHAQDAANDPARYRPQDVSIPLKDGGLSMAGVFYLPPRGTAPHPLVVLSHGSDADAAARRKFTLRGYWNPARYFLNRGFAVLYALRPSYGDSPGPYLEANGDCADPTYAEGFERMADTVEAAVRHGAARPDVDPRRVVLVGHSAGGAASIAAAARTLPGVVGFINFAGGKGGGEATPYAPCRPDKVGALFAGFAPKTTVPSLWIYAPNDLYFGRDIAPAWHRAYQAAGGQARLVITAPAADDASGHHIVQRALPLWIPAVDAYLKTLGFEITP